MWQMLLPLGTNILAPILIKFDYGPYLPVYSLRISIIYASEPHPPWNADPAIH